jgi:deazaflavin-dependent oxidoreductase (nitroreductase family)
VSLVASLQHAYLRFHAALYVRSGGRVGHRLAGVPSLILWTTGRRTGTSRPAVLIYARDGDGYAVVASNHGFDRPPAWLLNIRANPSVSVQVGPRRASARATVVEAGDPDYARLWTLVNVTNHQRYSHYQSQTERPIPVVEVTPTAPLR